MFEQIINFDRMEQAVALFGSFDENIKLIENQYSVNDPSGLDNAADYAPVLYYDRWNVQAGDLPCHISDRPEPA